MSTRFIYPDDSKDKIMEELNKLVKVLQIPPDPELKKNIRFLRGFTKSLFIISHKGSKQRKVSRWRLQEQQEEMDGFIQPVQIKKEYVQRQEIKRPPLPPPPPSPPSQQAGSYQDSNIEVNMPEIEQNHIFQLKNENGKLVYDIVEPKMESIDWQIYNQLRPIVKEAIKRDPNIVERPDFIENEVAKIAKNLKIKYSLDYVKKIKYYLEKNIKGFGKIDPLMRDSRVSKIICNSYDNIKVIFENETIPTNIIFDSNEELNNFIIGLAEKYGQKVSELEPTLEIKMPSMNIKAGYNPLTTSSFIITKTA